MSTNGKGLTAPALEARRQYAMNPQSAMFQDWPREDMVVAMKTRRARDDDAPVIVLNKDWKASA